MVLCRQVSVVLVLVCALLTAGWPAAAQVVVRPAKIEARVEDGSALPPIEVTNRGQAPVRVVVYTGFGGHDLDGSPVYRDDAWARSESSRILRPAEDELYVAPGTTVPLLATVRVPEGFAGGLYPVIFLELHPDGTQDAGSVRAVGRVAVVTLLSVGDAAPDMQAETVLVRPGQDAGTLEVAVRVRNDGDVHAVAGGSVTISDGSGVAVAKIPLGAATVLPGNARELVAHWIPPAAALGPYVATVHLEEPSPLPPIQVAFMLEPAPAIAGAGGNRW